MIVTIFGKSDIHIFLRAPTNIGPQHLLLAEEYSSHEETQGHVRAKSKAQNLSSEHILQNPIMSETIVTNRAQIRNAS